MEVPHALGGAGRAGGVQPERDLVGRTVGNVRDWRDGIEERLEPVHARFAGGFAIRLADDDLTQARKPIELVQNGP